jgi:hypothetical protein
MTMDDQGLAGRNGEGCSLMYLMMATVMELSLLSLVYTCQMLFQKWFLTDCIPRTKVVNLHGADMARNRVPLSSMDSQLSRNMS